MNKNRSAIGLEGLYPVIYGVIDFLIIIVTAFIAYHVRIPDTNSPSIYMGTVVVAGLLMIVISSLARVYDSWRGRSKWRLYLNITLSWIWAFVGVFTFLVLTKQAHMVSRVWLMIWLFLGVITACASRFVLYQIMFELREKGWNHKKVLLVGDTSTAAKVIESLHGAPWVGLDVAGVVSLDEKGGNVPENLVLSKVGLEDLPRVVQQLDAVEVWVCLPLSEVATIENALHVLRHNLVNIRYIPDWAGFQLLNHRVSHVGNLYTLDLVCSPYTAYSQAVKEIEDRVFAFLILFLLSPLMLMIAVLVKLTSRGPAFYLQERVGWNGKRFNMIKFRTMPDAVEEGSGPVWAKKGEERATMLGSILRRTSLDELPQFINVLKGEMSIVGPRPERTHFVDQFKDEIPGYMQKHHVKAGVTGWAQVNGWRGDTCLKTRIEHDLHYIENWSLFFDLKIILLTLFKGFIHKNAY